MRDDPIPAVLVVDYGQVISLPQPADAVRAMAAIAGVGLELFRERYWTHRIAYDRGGSPRAYWWAVAGRPLEDHLIAELSHQDVEAWRHLNLDVLAVLSQARERGCTLSLLSNAPHDLAVALAAEPALSQFDHRFFSADLGVIKPEPAAYISVLERIARRAEEVLFIDDRPANVDAARSVGMESLLFTSAQALRIRLLG